MARAAGLAAWLFVVLSGVGGRSYLRADEDYKDQLPRIAPRSPAESMKSFTITPGFRIEQVATEPLTTDPVDLCFDEDGRLWVVELYNYSEDDTLKKRGKVRVLEDTNGDGKFDKSRVFAEDLSWNASLALFEGGCFVTACPDLLYLKDTDGDGKADVREVILTGFPRKNINAFANSLRWRLDNRIHGLTGGVGGLLEAVKWNKAHPDQKPVKMNAGGRDFSIDPRTGELRLVSGGLQHGMGLDIWGRKYSCSNSYPIYVYMFEDRYIGRNPYMAGSSARSGIVSDGTKFYRTSPNEPWRIVRTARRAKSRPDSIEGRLGVTGYFTGCAGVTIYTGDAWPEKYLCNAFTGEGAGNLVHRRRIEPAGVGLKSYRTEEESEFINSTEIWFRAVQFCNAPDGNLYVADMYREVFEHPRSIPDVIKKHLDLDSGNDRGRIYRIVHEGFKQPKPVRMSKRSTEELVKLLAHTNGWHRRTAARLLWERQDKKAIEPLVKLASESASPFGRMHALYALDGLGALSADVVLARLDDEHPRVREHAVRLSEKVLADSAAVRNKLCAMPGDKDLLVRYQLAFTLGEISDAKATAALAAIAAGDADDRWVRMAITSSILGRAGDLLADLAADKTWRATSRGRWFLAELAEQAGLQKNDGQIAVVFDAAENLPEKEKGLAQSIIRGLGKGLDKAGRSIHKYLNAPERKRSAALLTEMIDDAKTVAVDEKQKAKRRVVAIQSLDLAIFEDTEELVTELLDGRQPQEVQMAALQVLGNYRNSAVADVILDAWLALSPKVQGEATETLFARRDRLRALLTAIEQKQVSPSQLDATRIKMLLEHSDKKIKAKAAELLSDEKLGLRKDVVADYRETLTMKGDRARGKAVFKKECSKCHRLEGEGVDLGLPLNDIKQRGVEVILTNTLDPNREVNPAYLNYVVVTDNGLTVTGMIESESATSITLKREEGEKSVVLRSSVDEIQNTGMSIMPEGLEKQLTKQNMADLIEYLMHVE